MKSIDEDIKTGQFQNIYLLYGEEAYLKRQYKEKLLKAMVTEGDTMNFSAYEGKDIVQGELIDLAETLPFCRAQGYFSGGQWLFLGNSVEELAAYIPEVAESTCFIFVESEVDKRNKLYKQVKKSGRIVCFERQNDEILMRWVGGRLKKEGKAMTRAAYQRFITKTGNDMENIDRELEKLICYCMDRETIEEEQVEAICVEQTENKIFEMINAISEKRQKQALDLYYDLLTLKEPPMRILFLILRQFQKLMLIKELSGQGADSRTIASKAGMPEFAVRKNQRMAGNFTMQQIREAIEDGVEFEESVKSGRMNDRIAVELLIVKCSQ